mmetsp:Transcript_19344/g.48720  ORF Transcript_19344/g.48720 Transcript_19344/m.48720 type:complete len:461 (+) Transcript_19344:124-1506(+)
MRALRGQTVLPRLGTRAILHHPLEHRDMGHAHLKDAAAFPHKIRHIQRLHHLVPGCQERLNPFRAVHRLACGRVLVATQPQLAVRHALLPVEGRRDKEQPAHLHHGRLPHQPAQWGLRAGGPLQQVDHHHRVVVHHVRGDAAGVHVAERHGVALLLADTARDVALAAQQPLLLQLDWHLSLRLHCLGRAYGGRVQVDAGDLVEDLGQLKRAAAHGATDVQAPGSAHSQRLAVLGQHLRELRREVAHGVGNAPAKLPKRLLLDAVVQQELRPERLLHLLAGGVPLGCGRVPVVDVRSGRVHAGCLQRALAAHDSEPGVLEEVRPEVEARKHRGFVAGGDEGAAHDDVVLAVVAWRREVVIQNTDAVAVGQRRKVVLAPLPHVAMDIVKATRVRGARVDGRFGSPGKVGVLSSAHLRARLEHDGVGCWLAVGVEGALVAQPVVLWLRQEAVRRLAADAVLAG